MRNSALRPFAVAGLIALTALLGACNDDVTAPAAPVAQQAACGGGVVATAQMHARPVSPRLPPRPLPDPGRFHQKSNQEQPAWPPIHDATF